MERNQQQHLCQNLWIKLPKSTLNEHIHPCDLKAYLNIISCFITKNIISINQEIQVNILKLYMGLWATKIVDF